ncbi:hypothetical protein G9P51_13280 [Escherichia coli]|nr:hypothetical protein G9P51_13280 [Escherichia coli]
MKNIAAQMVNFDREQMRRIANNMPEQYDEKPQVQQVKDALKHTYLGYETKDLVDVVTGDITTIQSLRHTSDLDTGEMYVFLCKVEAWAMNIGCHLTIPQSCEFQLLRDKQEA